MTTSLVDADVPQLLREMAAKDRRAADMASIRRTPNMTEVTRRSEYKRLTKRAEVLERAAQLLDRAIEACDV